MASRRVASGAADSGSLEMNEARAVANASKAESRRTATLGKSLEKAATLTDEVGLGGLTDKRESEN